MTEPTKTPDMQADEREAIEDIARMRQGHLLHRYLRREFETGALRGDVGGCSLAHRLMRHMASAIEETASDTSEYGGNQPIVSGSNAGSNGRRPTFREHILANDHELANDRGGGTANGAKPA